MKTPDPLISVPDDYDDLLNYYTKRGYRVIAIAGKSIEGLSWLKAQKMKRYIAYFIFQNSDSRWLMHGLQGASGVWPSLPRLGHI